MAFLSKRFFTICVSALVGIFILLLYCPIADAQNGYPPFFIFPPSIQGPLLSPFGNTFFRPPYQMLQGYLNYGNYRSFPTFSINPFTQGRQQLQFQTQAPFASYGAGYPSYGAGYPSLSPVNQNRVYPFQRTIPSQLPYTFLGYPNSGPTYYQPTSSQAKVLPTPQSIDEYPIPIDVPDERREAIKQALDWVFENPAQIQQYMAVEIGEEIMLFYQLYRRSGTQAGQTFCRDYIAARIGEIAKAGRLDSPTAGEITILLPICEIMTKLGLNLFDYRTFISQKVLTNPDIYMPTHLIWNSSILERLGFHPQTPVTQLVEQGHILSEYRSGLLLRLMDQPDVDRMIVMSRFYEIVHEIFPLTSFGETSIALLDPYEVSFLTDLIFRGIDFFLADPDVDILSELVIAAAMMGLKGEPSVGTAQQYVMDQQVDDGSFGDIQRLVEMGRSSPARHAVFVAIWALIQ